MFRISVLAPGIVVSMAFCPSPVFAQSLFARNHPQTKTISVDMSHQNLDLPGPISVNNGSTVTVLVRKNPIASCDVKFTTESVPKPDTIGQILSLLGPLTGKAAPPPAQFQPEALPTPLPMDKPLEQAIQDLGNNIADAQSTVTGYAEVSQELDQFSKCRDATGTDICSRRKDESDDTAAIKRVTDARDELAGDLNAVLKDNPPTSFPALENSAATIERSLFARAADRVYPPDPQWLNSAFKRLQQDKTSLLALGPDLENLGSVGNLLKKMQPILSSLNPATTWSTALPANSNRLLKGNLSCQNPFNQASASVPFSVTYQNMPELTPSAGLLVSFFSKRPIGIRSQSTPCASGTGDNCIAVTSTSKAQMLPIGMGNAYLLGSRNLNFSLAGGVGLNLNNGATEVEFFTGPSIAVHGFYLTPGLHIARVPQLGGGFVLGQAAPQGVSGSTLPISFHTTLHFGIVFSHAAPTSPKPPSN